MVIQTIKKNYGTLFEPKTQVGSMTIKSLSSSRTICKQLKKFFEDSDIKAIVLVMDCPGGTSGTSQAIFQELKLLKNQHVKPVIVWVENVCASGGYYIASAADHIIATPSSFIGSIGAYIPLYQAKELLNTLKVEYDPVVAGEYKLSGDPLSKTSAQQRAMLQELTKNTYEQFVKDVASSRPQLSLSKADEWAQGRIFTGLQALEKGLIDELGSWSTIESALKQKIAVTGTLEYVHAEKSSTLSRWFGKDEDDDNDSSYVEAALAHILRLGVSQSIQL